MTAQQTDHVIVAVHVTDRARHAGEVQGILTEYGAIVRTRLGLHDTTGAPSPNGLILLELAESGPGAEAMIAKLAAIPGVEVQTITFGH
ncbi:MAG: hypothetical protein GXY85_06485 [Candidatus Brocadiaceae bacterium]|nr:hypothetical protein [Candidatus Brocadiaceae bacterium]